MSQYSLLFVVSSIVCCLSICFSYQLDNVFFKEDNRFVSMDAPQEDVTSSCGRRIANAKDAQNSENISKRILGGKEAKKHDWPWQAYIRYIKRGSITTCSGVLVSTNIVLTVAQCMPSNDPKDYRIILGDHDISKIDGNETMHRLKRVIVPKIFNKTSLENDIALIQLEDSVSPNHFVNFVCIPPIPPPVYYTVPGTSCYMTGWGVKKSGSGMAMTRRIKELKLPVVHEPVCEKYLGKKLEQSQMCAGTKQNYSGGCKYDKGSPLVCFNKKSNRWVLQGLFSYSSQSCFSNDIRYSVFTRISIYSKAVQNMIMRFAPASGPTTVPILTTKISHSPQKLKSITSIHTTKAPLTSIPGTSTNKATTKINRPTDRTTKSMTTTKKSKTATKKSTTSARKSTMVTNKPTSMKTSTTSLTMSITPKSQTTTTLKAKSLEMKKQPIKIYLRSEGCYDKSRTGKDGRAYIIVNGVDYSPHQKGYNFVTLDIFTGKVERNASFDITTYSDLIKVKDFLRKIKLRKILLVAVQSDGSRYQVFVKRLLSKFGATSPFEVSPCSSFCLMGYSGPEHVLWTRQESHKQLEGPSEINGIVPPNEEVIKIKVESHMMENDGNQSMKSRAYIWVNGLDVSPHLDGYNVVTLDFDTGATKQTIAFHSKSSLLENKLLARYLKTLKKRLIIIVVTQGGSSKYHWIIRKSLSQYGASSRLELQEERLYAFVGYTGPEKVAWTAETFSPINRNMIDLDVFVNKGFSECGIKPEGVSRIVKYVVGGEGSQKGVWPWMTSIIDSHNKLVCGAALITDEWVLTAAHCFDETTFRSRPFKVILGSVKYMGDSESEKITISGIYQHPKFNRLTYDYDIAVIKLQRKAVIRNEIRKICIGETERMLPGSCYISGWGRVKQGGKYPEDLKHAKVPIVPTEICNNTKIYKSKITDRMFCAGYEGGGIDACQGDSGGPLSCQDANGYWRLVGVISWGAGCALPHHYGVYTNVTAFKDWISNTIRLS